MAGRKSVRLCSLVILDARQELIRHTQAIEQLERRELLDASSITVVPYQTSADAMTLSSALLGPTPNLAILSASFLGADGQAGFYSGFHLSDGQTSVNLPDGILLTTGSAAIAAQNNDDSGAGDSLEGPGDADLDALIGGESTFDRASLTIQFTADPGVKSIQFSFVFGSEEFPEYVSQYNDVFGAYLDGVQISFDANNAPISVNNNFFLLNNSGDTSDSNTLGKTVVNLPIQYDGLTPRITTQRELDTGLSVHTLKLVIADAGDDALDSAVFLAGLRGTAGGSGTGQAPVANAGGPYPVTSGGSVQLDASATTDPDQAAETLEYTWDLDGDSVYGETGANATNGDEVGVHPIFKVPENQQGDFFVALQVRDSTGLVSSSSATITTVAGSKQLVIQQLATPIGGSNDIAHAIAMQADGKFVVAGYASVDGHYQFALARYNADASLDTSFSGDGKVFTKFGDLNDGALAVAIQPDGKIVAAGYSWQGSQYRVALARYNTDGSLDTTFGGDGRVTAAIGVSADAGFSVEVTPQGKILVAGLSLAQGASDFGLVQFNTDGSLDKSFGNSGTVRTAVSTGEDRIEGVQLTADGRIVVAGWTTGASGDDVAIARYLPNGRLDTSFNSTGVRKLSLSDGSDRARGLVVVGDSMYVLATSAVNGTSQYSLLRLSANGQLDTNFGDQGIARTPIVAGISGNVAISIQDGKLLVLTGDNLRRYNIDGTPDRTFNSGGTYPFTPAWRQGMLNDIDQVTDQPVTMVGGYVTGRDYDFAIVRLINDTVPVAVNDQTSWSSGEVTLNLLANDYDLDEGDAVDPTSVTIVVGPAVGTISSLVNGVVTYTPPQQGFTGTSFRYTVKDRYGVVSNEATVTVSLANLAPVITSNGGGPTANVSVAEYTTAVTTVVATDADLPAQTLTYSIIGGADSSLFTINPSSGVLSFIAAPSFIPNPDGEPDNNYQVTVQVSDGTLTDTQALTVSVTNTNDPPVITSNGGGATATIFVAERTTAVTTVTATDADLPAQTLTYSIIGGADSSLFTINPSTGVLSFIAAPSFIPNPDGEPDNNYQVSVQVSDGTLADTQALTVTVTDVNEPPVISSNGGGETAVVSVAEHTAIVANVTAIDPDLPAQTLTYSINGGADSSMFTIDSATGLLSFVSAPVFFANPDGNLDNDYEVTVQVSDGSLTDSQTLTVLVTNTNDPPVITSGGGGTIANVLVVENTAFATTVMAIDPDQPLQSITYSIVGGVDSSLFAIDPSTGVLSFISPPTFIPNPSSEPDNNYEVTVQVSDGALTDTQAITVTVTDANDPPVITSDGGGDTASLFVQENTTAVTTVTADDSDIQSQQLSFSIVGGADSGDFLIDAATGTLLFTFAPDFETPADANTDNVYQVVVQVSDGSLVDTQAISVTIFDQSELAPPAFASSASDSTSVSQAPVMAEQVLAKVVNRLIAAVEIAARLPTPAVSNTPAPTTKPLFHVPLSVLPPVARAAIVSSLVSAGRTSVAGPPVAQAEAIAQLANSGKLPQAEEIAGKLAKPLTANSRSPLAGYSLQQLWVLDEFFTRLTNSATGDRRRVS